MITRQVWRKCPEEHESLWKIHKVRTDNLIPMCFTHTNTSTTTNPNTSLYKALYLFTKFDHRFQECWDITTTSATLSMQPANRLPWLSKAATRTIKTPKSVSASSTKRAQPVLQQTIVHGTGKRIYVGKVVFGWMYAIGFQVSVAYSCIIYLHVYIIYTP